jgi:site-specific DNA-methyltransferase (adenine-specific)
MLLNKIIQGDCLQVMKDIPDKSVDMILCDLPYGTTACKWDTVIPFEPLWEQYKRIIKDNGAIVLTASQPFTSALVMSNVKMFKYEWIYGKNSSSNFVVAKSQPLKQHENILVFCKCKTIYNPQKEERSESGKKRIKAGYKSNSISGDTLSNMKTKRIGQVYDENLKFPSTIQHFNCKSSDARGLHPTQKPVALFEYLIKTYTNEGDLVLDNAAGSGTTGVACKNLNRNFILIEKEPEYVKICEERIKAVPESLF